MNSSFRIFFNFFFLILLMTCEKEFFSDFYFLFFFKVNLEILNKSKYAEGNLVFSRGNSNHGGEDKLLDVAKVLPFFKSVNACHNGRLSRVKSSTIH
jgi:hypothetical protein